MMVLPSRTRASGSRRSMKAGASPGRHTVVNVPVGTRFCHPIHAKKLRAASSIAACARQTAMVCLFIYFFDCHCEPKAKQSYLMSLRAEGEAILLDVIASRSE